MTSNALPNPSTGSAGDILKYVVTLLLAVAGIVAYYLLANDLPSGVRMLIVAAGLIAAGGVFWFTAKGAKARNFLAESRFELRKVVWPTRQEAMRMTWVVIIVVIIIALLLAGFDTVIQWLVKLFLGQ